MEEALFANECALMELGRIRKRPSCNANSLTFGAKFTAGMMLSAQVRALVRGFI